MKSPVSEKVTVTPEMADGWLNHNLYERQRRRAEWHVQRLAIEMEKGRFIAGTQIHFGVHGGNLRLVNGQHTLAAIARSGMPVELTVLYTTVEDESELGQLYGRHDRHRGRTPHDAFLGLGLSKELGLTEPEVNSFGAALKWLLMDFRRVSVQQNAEVAASIDHLAEEMRRWSEAAGLYFDATRDARYGMKGAFRRAPVVAVGLATFQHQPDRASEFWGGASKDDGLHRLDPRRALNSFLAQSTTSRGDPMTYMRSVAGAWNKFYSEDELQFIRPGDMGKIGITIKGTPYKAEKRKGRGPTVYRDHASSTQVDSDEVTSA